MIAGRYTYALSWAGRSSANHPGLTFIVRHLRLPDFPEGKTAMKMHRLSCALIFLDVDVVDPVACSARKTRFNVLPFKV